MRVIVVSIVLAFLGAMYIIANPEDGGMRGFGWFLVFVGALVAGIFSYLWYRKNYMDTGEQTDGETKATADKKG